MMSHYTGRLQAIPGTNFIVPDGAAACFSLTGAIAVSPDDARRLAACWNACLFLDTGSIEQFAASGGVIALALAAEQRTGVPAFECEGSANVA